MLSYEHICKTFNPGTPDAVTLFDDFNLTVDDGEFVSIIGSNGSGKTTMLNLLCGSPRGRKRHHKSCGIPPCRAYRQSFSGPEGGHMQ